MEGGLEGLYPTQTPLPPWRPEMPAWTQSHRIRTFSVILPTGDSTASKLIQGRLIYSH